jgi:hypothetical protein
MLLSVCILPQALDAHPDDGTHAAKGVAHRRDERAIA